MIHAIVKIMVPPEKRNEALGILRSVTQQSRFHPGCLSSTVYNDVELDNVIMIEELWSNEEALEGHLRSDEYYKVLIVAEMSVTPPEIRFDKILSSTGIETIEKARMA